MEPTVRHAARALIVDAEHRVLLVRFHDGAHHWWATPGGGLEAGETHEQAVRRELAEEVDLPDAVLGPLLWTREHTFPWRERVIRQRERIFLVRIARHVAPRATEAHAHEGIDDLRWWTLDELQTADATFSPRRLPALVRTLFTDGPPPTPLDVGT